LLFVLLITTGWADEVRCAGGELVAIDRKGETMYVHIDIEDVPTVIALFLLDVCRVN
jgi:hypothetical protein